MHFETGIQTRGARPTAPGSLRPRQAEEPIPDLSPARDPCTFRRLGTLPQSNPTELILR